MLILHPCQQAAEFLTYTRTADIVVSRRFFMFFCVRAQFFSTRAATLV
jgi:hypothetical protein